MSLEELLAWIPPGSADEALARQVNFEQLPAHIAIIMDGNGRWAAQRHLPRVEGHRAGIDSVRDVVETSARLGIEVLTLYAFSVENWKRPRAEIVDAARRALAAGVSPDALDERRFSDFLYTAGQPDPDLLIRTSGEMRVSNYLLWQIAYAEIYVTETLWPDFRRRHLLEAVLAYQKRERRYGGISASQAATRLRSGQARAK